jgi:acetyl-CoA carboxylase carboxyltransferase component
MGLTVERGGLPRAQERLERLCDEGSLSIIRSAVASSRLGAAPARGGDGVVVGTGEVDGRPVACYAQDPEYLGGSLGEAHAESIMRVLRLAGEARCPVVALVASAGAPVQEGTAALSGYARIFRHQVLLSGRVPQIAVITGASAGGGSYSPALADFVVMDREASMFLTGPGVVRQVMREDVTAAELGGTKVHSRNGVCDFVGSDPEQCLAIVRDLLGYLPQSAGQLPPVRAGEWSRHDDPARHLPAHPREVYDIRDVIGDIVDDERLLECAPKWAPNMCCGFASVDGRPIGVIANQPLRLGGVIDAEASQKAARFIRRADSFGLPLLVLVDTPGFLPGVKQEHAGVIRHGADLLRAFAAAQVPKVTVVLRKAYGGAYITMNSRDLGAHLTFAWPQAEIGVMGAPQAVGFMHRRELNDVAPDDAAELHARLAATYASEHLAVEAAAREGFIDEVIAPSDTRLRVRWAFRALATRRRRATDSPYSANDDSQITPNERKSA